MSSAKRGTPLHVKILIALVLGFIVGLIVQNTVGSKDPNVLWILDNLATPLKSIFLNMIFMVVIPLLFAALVLGVTEIGDAKKVGKVGLYSIALTVVLSGIAVGIGIAGVNLAKPGDGISVQQRNEFIAKFSDKKKAVEAEENAKKAKSAAQTITDIVPKNPVASANDFFGEGLLGFMFFALVFGLAMGSIEAEKAQPLKVFFEGLFAVSLRMLEFAMKLAPYGVFALTFIAGVSLGVDALLALGKYAGLVLVCLAIHLFIVYSLTLRVVAKRNPFEFFRQVRSVMFTAFATSSSNATLPTALRVAEEEVGLPKDISSFVLTVGATANQNGTALFEGITIIFLAQMYGIALTFMDQLGIMGLAILAGVGTAGVPGGSLPIIVVILTKYGIPAEGIGLIYGIDRILDMSRTVLNVVGDITIATCVSKLVGEKKSLEEAVSG